MRFRQAPGSGLFAAPPFVHPRGRVPPQTVGRWLLETDADGPLATVEAVAQVSHFSVLQILVSPYAGVGGWRSEQGRRALSFVVSGLMILTKADIVRILPVNPTLGSELADLGWGTTGEIHAFVAGVATEVPVRIKTLTIDPYQWWETEPGKSDHASLTYLEKRIKLEDEKAKPARRSRAGIFDLLSKLLRWQ